MDKKTEKFDTTVMLDMRVVMDNTQENSICNDVGSEEWVMDKKHFGKFHMAATLYLKSG